MTDLSVLRCTAELPPDRVPARVTRVDPARFPAWRTLRAEAHRRPLRVDARARAAERARLRPVHRAVREQPDRLR